MDYFAGGGMPTATSSKGTFGSPQDTSGAPRIGLMPYGGGPSMGTIGQPSGIRAVPWGNGSEDPTRNPYPGGSPLGGVTRRGSQMIDAQGNVIGHYGDNNEPIYHQGQGPGLPDPQRPDWGPWGPRLPGGAMDQMRPGPVASTSMGMPPQYQRMQMPSGGVQDVPSAYAPQYLQQGGSLTGESTQYPRTHWRTWAEAGIADGDVGLARAAPPRGDRPRE